MKTAVIFYFSGTGNTEIVAQLFAEAFLQKEIHVDLIKIDDVIKGRLPLNVETYDLIGVGHPVLGFGASGIVDRFARQLPQVQNKKAFVFKTASSHHYVNQGASDEIIRTMGQKGYDVFHNSILAMACNWFLKYEDSLIKQLYEIARWKVKRYADEVLRYQPRHLKINFFLKKVLRLMYYLEENLGAKQFSSGLKTSGNCKMCKECVKLCPVENIRIEQDSIQFGKKCIWCMRCIYHCPFEAITATRIKTCVLQPYNGGKKIHELMKDAAVSSDFITPKSKGYYRHFIPYVFEELTNDMDDQK